MLKINWLSAANCRQAKARACRMTCAVDRNCTCTQLRLYLPQILTQIFCLHLSVSRRTYLCQMYAHGTRRRVGRYVLPTFWKRVCEVTPCNLLHVSEKHVVSIFRTGGSLEILKINKPRQLGMQNFVR